MRDKVPGDLKAALEALLYAAPAPLGVKRICEIIPKAEKEQVKDALSMLTHEMARPGRGIELVKVAGGWRIQTRSAFRKQVLMLKRQPAHRLSRATLETLAVVAYRQPVTRAEIEQARGVDSSGTIRHLLDGKLIRITGRKDLPGRPLIYGTTRHFLEVFQLSDLSALPSHKEFRLEKREMQLPLFNMPDPDQKQT